MSITTFADLITKTAAHRICLIEIEPSELLASWTLYSGSVYYNEVGHFHVLSVEEDGVALTEATSIAGVTAGKWFFDASTGRLYLQASSGSIFSKVIVANYRLYFSSNTATTGGGIIFNDRFYEPFLAATPPIRQKKTDLFWGVSTVSDGMVSLINHDGYFDAIYSRFAWSNKTLRVLLGGEELPYAEYQTLFAGVIFEKQFGKTLFELSFVDKKYDLSDNLVANEFTEGTYPYIEAQYLGQPIPMVWGTVYRMRATCTNGLQATATTYGFKFADTSLGSVFQLSHVYVNGNRVPYASMDLSAGTFTLSQSVFRVGDAVSVDCMGYTSGGALVENPVEILKAVLARHGIAYNATNFDTTAMAAAVADAAVFPCGLAITEPIAVLDIVKDLMASCMGSLFNENDGRFAVAIWDTDQPASVTVVTELDIHQKTFGASARSEHVRKVCRVGWGRNWETEDYRYKQVTSQTAERVYGTTKSRTIPTLLSTAAGAEVYAGRALLMLESEVTVFQFTSKLLLAAHNVADRFAIAFKRTENSDNLPWADEQIVEIEEIEKDLDKAIIEIVARDLKEVGFAIGHWTSDTPTFPATLGGGSMTPWSSAWSAAQKAYAKAHAGYWTDANGFADPLDEDSRMISRWW